jgi:gamma-glutamylcyclotransferase (GGCT)/AIG2-like uncharacterized protein YtfP
MDRSRFLFLEVHGGDRQITIELESISRVLASRGETNAAGTMTRLFIYGTLKRGHGRAGLLADQHYLGEARTRPRYRLYRVDQYPGLVHAEKGVAVEGELWDVKVECLAELDRVEAVDAGLYRRETIELEAGGQQQPVEAYFYLHPVEGLEDCGRCWTG